MSVTTLRPPPDPRRTLLDEHDRLTALVMMLVDRIEIEVDAVEHSINPRKLRRATAETLRQSIARCDAALAELGFTVTERPHIEVATEGIEPRALHAITEHEEA